MRYKLLQLTLLMVILLASLPARAQENLSTEERALIDRVIVALDAVATYDSYVATQQTQESTTITLKNGAAPLQTQTTNTSSEATLTVTRGDNEQARRVVTLSQQRNDESIMLTGELRLVDGVLYAMLDRIDQDEITDNRWRIIENTNITGIFGVLDPAGFLETVRGTQSAIAADMEFLSAFISSVEQTMIEDNDGNPIEVITLSVNAGALSSFFVASTLAEGGQPQATIFDFLSDTSGQQMVVFLDAQGRLVQTVNTTILEANDRNAQLIFPQAREEMTVDFQSTTAEITQISRINEMLEPVAIPEVDDDSGS
ncbi:MAG: hypothetical protein D6737_02835 [Chloroflexi bacterium]|nr:MAG: hypothetical protein D6737_02835 [Chloroflexota bacterium]